MKILKNNETLTDTNGYPTELICGCDVLPVSHVHHARVSCDLCAFTAVSKRRFGDHILNVCTVCKFKGEPVND